MLSYLIFCLRDLQYGIDVTCVREIFPLPELMSVPDAPADIIGLLNWRGKVLPVMHLDRRLGQPVQRCQLSDRVIVIESQGLQVGMVVHQVEEVWALDPTAIETDVSYGRDRPINTAFLRGVAKVESSLVLLLNPDTLIRMVDEVADLTGETVALGLDHHGLGRGLDFDPNASLAHADKLRSPAEWPRTDFYPLYCPDASMAERETFQRRARDLRQPFEDEQAQNLTALAVIRLENEYFGIHLESIREFITVSKVSPIPCCPEPIVGNMNLRGEVMTLIDVRSILNLPPTERPIEQAVITQVGEIIAGITVDEVRNILFLPLSNLTPLPTAVKEGKASFLQGMAQYDKTLLSVLNLPKLLCADQFTVLDHV